MRQCVNYVFRVTVAGSQAGDLGSNAACTIFARDSIYAKRAYAIAIPSVRLSVRPSVTRVIHAKTVVVRIVQFSPYSSPIPLVFAR